MGQDLISQQRTREEKQSAELRIVCRWGLGEEKQVKQVILLVFCRECRMWCASCFDLQIEDKYGKRCTQLTDIMSWAEPETKSATIAAATIIIVDISLRQEEGRKDPCKQVM